MQETLGFDKDEAHQKIEVSKGKMRKIFKITEAQANRVQVHYAQTTYVLGEDVPKHTGYSSKDPVIVFNATDEVMAVYQIKPSGDTTTRDIVIAIGNGEFKGKLKDVL
jgi:glycerol dehydrogenase-like iron-containing ADH family enzyme